MLSDLILIVMLLIFAFVGMKKGFMSSILSIAGVLLALILSFVLVRPIVDALVGSSFHNTISQGVLKSLSSLGSVMSSTIPDEASLVDTLALSMPLFLAKILASAASGVIGTSQNMSVAELVEPFFTNIVFTILLFVIIFVSLLIVFSLLKMLVKGITSLPILKQVDMLLGFFLGILKGLIFTSIILLIVSITSFEFLSPVLSSIENSFITKFLFENNPLLLLITGIFG